MKVLWRCPNCESPITLHVDTSTTRQSPSHTTVHVDTRLMDLAITVHVASHER